MHLKRNSYKQQQCKNENCYSLVENCMLHVDDEVYETKTAVKRKLSKWNESAFSLENHVRTLEPVR
jgi:hypothetical protein